MKILGIKDKHAEITACVRDHVESFASSCHQIEWARGNECLDGYDAIFLHYSMPLSIPLPTRWKREIARFTGFKIALRQDEYQYTNLVGAALEGFDLVFTCVPIESIGNVYPGLKCKFVEVLTGYVPKRLECVERTRLTDRPITVGYRGRELSPAYGRLGRQKYTLAVAAEWEARARGVPTSIATSSEARLQGDSWDTLLRSSKVVLGTESGSNVFDFDNRLYERFGCPVGSQWRDERTWESEYKTHVEHLDGRDAILNQVSPRVFEAAAHGTAMALIEGSYSGVVRPLEHYIPIKEDLSNLVEVFNAFEDVGAMQAMADRAHADVIASGRWSYRNFIALFDSCVNELRR